MFLLDSLNYFDGMNKFAWRVHCIAHLFQIISGWSCESVKRICHHLVAGSCPFTVQFWSCHKTSANVVCMYTAFMFDLKLRDCFVVLILDSILLDIKMERLGTVLKTDAIHLFILFFKVGSLLKALCSRLLTVKSQSSWFCFISCLVHSSELTQQQTPTCIFFCFPGAARGLISELPRKKPNQLFQISYAIYPMHIYGFSLQHTWAFLSLPTFLFTCFHFFFLVVIPVFVCWELSCCYVPGTQYILSSVSEAVGCLGCVGTFIPLRYHQA